MTNNLQKILSEQEQQKYATATGQRQHLKLKQVCTETMVGDKDLLEIIKSNSDLERFFHSDARTEVPIAGVLDGKFLSRRIDRMYVSEQEKTVFVLDYKTDTDKNAFLPKYIQQIREYKRLLQDAFPSYKVRGFILWLSDFTMQEISD